MFNMGGGELIIIALLALILIKPDKLPGVATSLGRWFHDLQRGITEVKNSFESTLKEKPKKLELKKDESKPST